MVKNIKKIILTILLAYTSLFVMTSAFAAVPENSTIEVTIGDIDSVIIFDNTTDISEFTLNLTDETDIIDNLSILLNVSIEEIEAIITFANATTEEPNVLENTQINVLIHIAQNNSDVTIFENDTQTNNFILNLTVQDEIIDELALLYNVTTQEIINVTSFEIDNTTINSLENIVIKVLLNENENVTEVTVFENSIQTNSFVLNTTNAAMIVDEIALELNANKSDVANAIVNEIIVKTTLGEWTLFVFFDKFVTLYNVIEDNINGENPFPPNSQISSGRILTPATNFSDMNSEIEVAVDYERWLMFKFFRIFANSNDRFMLLLNS